MKRKTLVPAIALAGGRWAVSVVNPAWVKGFAQGELSRNKTDRADAKLLTRFCAAMRPALWEPCRQSTGNCARWWIGCKP